MSPENENLSPGSRELSPENIKVSSTKTNDCGDTGVIGDKSDYIITG